MKNKRSQILLASLCFLLFTSLFKSKTFAERIESFNSNIQINKDGTVAVEETAGKICVFCL